MDISTDEVRRELRESQREHAASLHPFRETLARVFDRSGGRTASDQAKREVLGLPGRRKFITVGGATVAMSALLAACGSDTSEEGVPESGQRPDPDAEPSEIEVSSPEMDITLLRTAQSLEELAIVAYQAAIDSGQVTTAAIAEAAVLFQSQHQDHAGLLESATEDAGGTPFTEPNPVLLAQLSGVVEGLGSADELVIVQVAADLENMAAQTYSFAGGIFTTPELRQASLSIGATEARHLTLLKSVLAQEPVEFPFLPTRGRVPTAALLPEGEDGQRAAEAITPDTLAADGAEGEEGEDGEGTDDTTEE